MKSHFIVLLLVALPVIYGQDVPFQCCGSDDPKFKDISCPSGGILRNDVCYKTNGKIQICTDADCNANCPTGSLYNSILHHCYGCKACDWNTDENSVECPDGSIWENGVCVQPISRLIGKPFCGTRDTLQNPCLYGFEMVNGRCVKPIVEAPPGSMFERPGRKLNPNVAPPIQCPIGYRFQNGRCVPNQCPVGYRLENGQCVQQIYAPIQCPVGYSPENGQCVLLSFARIQCPPGTRLENGRCVQQIFAPIQCPVGYRLENEQCVLIS